MNLNRKQYEAASVGVWFVLTAFAGVAILVTATSFGSVDNVTARLAIQLCLIVAAVAVSQAAAYAAIVFLRRYRAPEPAAAAPEMRDVNVEHITLGVAEEDRLEPDPEHPLFGDNQPTDD